MSEPSSIYVSRKEAEAVEHEFAEALKQPAVGPVVFQIWGIGGVGKTTLIKRLRQKHEQPANSAKRSWQKHEQPANFAEFSFHLEVVIQDPIELMEKLYEQLSEPPKFILMRDLLPSSDPFKEKLKKYREALQQLENQPLPGRKAVETDQLNAVEQLVKGTATFALPIVTQGRFGPAAAEDVADAAIATATTVLRLRDELINSVREKDEELQNLILKPLPELTKAFVEGLSQWAEKCPVVVILDTYEKAPSFVDTWLCNVLLPLLPEFRSQPIRWVIAGRYKLTTQKEVWRRVQQDIEPLNGYDECKLDRFKEDQVKEYFQAVGITEPLEIKEIFLKTKGLP